MNNEKLQSLVERITREILTTNITPSKKVLFIFCDSTAHEAFSDIFISLRNNFIEHDLLFLDGETSAWLGLHTVQSTGSKQILAVDEYAPAPIELPKEYDAIVVPEIDLDNAARIAMGLKGTVKSEIIFSALVLEKPVITCSDVPGIKRSDRRTLKALKLPHAYKQRFQTYMSELKEMGIHFCEQSTLSEKISNVLHGPRLSEDTLTFEGTVLSSSWLTSSRLKKGPLFVKKNTIITPLAKDYMKEKKITIIEV